MRKTLVMGGFGLGCLAPAYPGAEAHSGPVLLTGEVLAHHGIVYNRE